MTSLPAPAWASHLRRFTCWLSQDCGGGPWPWKLAWVWLVVFTPNMILKEASLSRYPGWADYRRRSWWLLPFVL